MHLFVLSYLLVGWSYALWSLGFFMGARGGLPLAQGALVVANRTLAWPLHIAAAVYLASRPDRQEAQEAARQYVLNAEDEDVL
jgi:hypothetical protein